MAERVSPCPETVLKKWPEQEVSQRHSETNQRSASPPRAFLFLFGRPDEPPQQEQVVIEFAGACPASTFDPIRPDSDVCVGNLQDASFPVLAD